MNVNLLPILLLAATSLAAHAGQAPTGGQHTTDLRPISTTAPQPIRGQRALDLLALETGLTPRLVRTVVTHRAAENYAFRHERTAARQFQAVLGEERYATLMAGRPIELYSMQVREAVRSMATSAPDKATPAVLVTAAD